MDMDAPAATAGASVAAEVPVAATEEDIGKEVTPAAPAETVDGYRARRL